MKNKKVLKIYKVVKNNEAINVNEVIEIYKLTKNYEVIKVY